MLRSGGSLKKEDAGPIACVTGRDTTLVVLVVFIVALGVRLLYLWSQADANPVFHNPVMDNAIHHQWASRVASGEGLGPKPYFRAPLYYLALGAVYTMTGPSVVVARVANSVVGALGCALLALLGIQLSSTRTGLIAGLLAALYWPLVYFDGEMLTLSLEVTLNLLLLVLLVRLDREGREVARWLPALAGFVFGLSAITRPNVLAFAPVVVAWAWWTLPRPRRVRHVAIRVGALAVGAACAVGPVAARNLMVGGEAVLVATNGGVNFYIGNNPQSDGVTAVVPGTRPGWIEGYDDTHRIAEEAAGRSLTESEVSGFWFRRAVDWIRSDPSSWVHLVAYKFRLFWNPSEIGNNQAVAPFARLSWVIRALRWNGFPLAILLAGLGVVLAPWDRRWLVPAAFAGIHAATVVAFFVNARYRLPVVPVLLLFAAVALQKLPELLRDLRSRRAAMALGVAAVAGVLMATAPPSRSEVLLSDTFNYHLFLAVFYATPQPEGGGREDLALEHYRDAVRVRPGHAESRLAYAQLLMREQRWLEARQTLERATALHPDLVEASVFLATVYVRLGEVALAEAELRRALVVTPREPSLLEGLGCLLSHVGRHDEARPVLRQALVLVPDSDRARRCLEASVAQDPLPEP
jgi:Tfp pilus assembly protein PilF